MFNVTNILGDGEREAFLSGFHRKHYGKGSIICGPDTGHTGIFVVSEGKLRVFLLGEDREITLFYLVPGDIFCTHSRCTVQAVEDADIQLADLPTVERKLRDSPGLAWKMFEVIGGAMISSLRTIESLAFQDVRQRISQFFLQQAGPTGDVDIKGDDLHGTLTIEDIANLVGSARQTTSTALNTLIKEGLVKRVSRGRYAILDQPRLAALAGGSLLDGMAPDMSARRRRRA